MSPQFLLFVIAIIAGGALIAKMEDRPKASGNMTAGDRRAQRPNDGARESTQGTRVTTGEEGLRFAQARPPSVG